MHGRKKTSVELTEEEKVAVTSKVAAYRKLSEKLLQARHAVQANPENAIAQVSSGLLTSQAQLLTVNPDFSTLWNHRKELLLAQQVLSAAAAAAEETAEEEGRAGDETGQGSNGGSRGEARAAKAAAAVQMAGRLGPCAWPPSPLAPADLEKELDVTAAAIRKQPKSYGAWHHRLWVVQGHTRGSARGAAGTGAASSAAAVSSLLSGEVALCGQLLELDQRNFHCWAYRLAVARMAGVSAAEELAFTLEKITENFSNYSAFHYRSKVLERLLREDRRRRRRRPDSHGGEGGFVGGGEALRGESGGLADLLVSELDMVGQAAFTEPDDQSAWWYHRFLLDWGFRALVLTGAEGDEDEHDEDEHEHEDDSTDGKEPRAPAELSVEASAAETAAAYGACLIGECGQLRELREMEPGCKWARATLANTLAARLRYLEATATLRAGTGEGGGLVEEEKEEEGVEEIQAELFGELAALIELDPPRAGYYRHMMAQTRVGASQSEQDTRS